MGLQVTGSVRNGESPVVTEVKLEVREKGTGTRLWETTTDTLDDGTFYHEIVDATGQNRDYTGRTLHGEVIGPSGFSPQDVVIQGARVELHFSRPSPIRFWTKLKERILGAALLSPDRYEEIAASNPATSQALIVAILASVGFATIWAIKGGAENLVVMAPILLVVLGVWALATYLLGTTVLATPTTSTTLAKFLRAAGFATTPLLIGGPILALLAVAKVSPGLLFLLLIGILLWELLALTVASHQALGYRRNWGRALLAVVMPVAVAVALIWLLAPS